MVPLMFAEKLVWLALPSLNVNPMSTKPVLAEIIV